MDEFELFGGKVCQMSCLVVGLPVFSNVVAIFGAEIILLEVNYFKIIIKKNIKIFFFKISFFKKKIDS